MASYKEVKNLMKLISEEEQDAMKVGFRKERNCDSKVPGVNGVTKPLDYTRRTFGNNGAVKDFVLLHVKKDNKAARKLLKAEDADALRTAVIGACVWKEEFFEFLKKHETVDYKTESDKNKTKKAAASKKSSKKEAKSDSDSESEDEKKKAKKKAAASKKSSSKKAAKSDSDTDSEDEKKKPKKKGSTSSSSKKAKSDSESDCDSKKTTKSSKSSKKTSSKSKKQVSDSDSD